MKAFPESLNLGSCAGSFRLGMVDFSAFSHDFQVANGCAMVAYKKIEARRLLLEAIAVEFNNI